MMWVMKNQALGEVNDMMNKTGWKVSAALAIVALLALSAAPAQGRDGLRRFGSFGGHRGFRSHGGFRTSIGISIAPFWYPWLWSVPVYRGPGYYDSYDYYQPPPVMTQPPRVYEQQVPAPQGGQAYWYYCQDPPGYYPYVSQCPGGWTKTAPSPETAQPPAAEPQAPRASSEPGPVPEEYRWYRCEDPPGYYPYIQECPGGWTEVAPAPAR
jgi:hypothetical protein